MSALRHHGDLPERREHERKPRRIDADVRSSCGKRGGDEDHEYGNNKECTPAKPFSLRFRSARLIGRCNGCFQRDHDITEGEDGDHDRKDGSERKARQCVACDRGDGADEKYALNETAVNAARVRAAREAA